MESLHHFTACTCAFYRKKTLKSVKQVVHPSIFYTVQLLLFMVAGELQHIPLIFFIIIIILYYFTFIQVRQFRLPVNFQFHCWPDSRVKQSKNYTRNWSLGNLGEWMTIHISTEWEMSPHCLHQNQAYVLWHYHWL